MIAYATRSALRIRGRAVVVAGGVAALTGIAVASAPAGATYPGSKNGRLAFGMLVNGNVEIYSVLPNGAGLQRLTTDPAFDACATYSPDGKQIAFCSDRRGTNEIWQMHQNGKWQRPVTHLGSALWPDYSPDGLESPSRASSRPTRAPRSTP